MVSFLSLCVQLLRMPGQEIGEDSLHLFNAVLVAAQGRQDLLQARLLTPPLLLLINPSRCHSFLGKSNQTKPSEY
jgi:hypothetical protein